MRILAAFIFLILFEYCAFAATDAQIADTKIANDDFVPAAQLLNRAPDSTECASGVFARALTTHADKITADAPESDVQQWIHQVFALPDVLTAVLQCPEFAGLDDDDPVKFIPIEYTFPTGRRIVINYETQPKILQQRITLGAKRSITDNNPSPRIGGADDTSIWANTDPAWYAIMVVESGALNEFIGPGKNNTISMQYVNDNIDRLYPSGFTCTDKSALANDNFMINRAVHETVGLGADDSNDYYVAGDVNLQWISYAEIALDVVITVVTVGGGTAALGAAKGARATRILRTLSGDLRALSKLDTVRDYMRLSTRSEKLAKDLKKVNRLTNHAEYTRITDEMKKLSKTMQEMEKIDDVKKYKEASESFKEINQLRHGIQGMRKLRVAQRGNVIARAWRAFKSANTGGKALDTGARVARSSIKSGKIRDWLFHATMRNAGHLAKMEETGGLLYGALKTVGDFYDYTETSTGKFTSGIEFKPLLLLSADDLQNGQDNVVNYGMWLMWAGDTISAADDDAAYLQAMDFAEKFHQDLIKTQEEANSHACNVDIYVVRPVIRDPGTNDAQLYWLIMNDTPWTTAQ